MLLLIRERHLRLLRKQTQRLKPAQMTMTTVKANRATNLLKKKMQKYVDYVQSLLLSARILLELLVALPCIPQGEFMLLQSPCTLVYNLFLFSFVRQLTVLCAFLHHFRWSPATWATTTRSTCSASGECGCLATRK